MSIKRMALLGAAALTVAACASMGGSGNSMSFFVTSTGSGQGAAFGGLAGAGYRISTSGAAERQGVVHRLDVGTTGLMVVAKSERAYTELKRQFHDREVDKIYHAVVQGHPDPFSGTIDAPIGRHPSSAWKFAVTADAVGPALIAAGTTPTGAHQTLPAGATTDILVGGGTSALPVWTSSTGSGKPVRQTSPTLVTPDIGTPSTGVLTNCTGLPTAGLVAGAVT